jgi:TolA-binding protein
MHSKSLRNRFLTVAAIILLLTVAPSPARAASKEIIELQTQVQQLLDSVQRIQSTLDARFGVLQHLAEQTADNANQMTAIVNALQQKIAAQSDTTNGKLDTASGQVQSLNDSVDELKSRINKLDKSLQDLQTQLQNIQNPPAPQPTAAPASANPSTAPNATVPEGAAAAAASPIDQKPPLAETFQAGVRDFNAAKYELANGEFQDVIHYYSLDDLAGTAHFYQGEIAARQNKLSDAVKAYNAVLDGFPGNTKAPAAQLHKGLALLQMSRKEAGIHELRLLIQRHPATPEAAQARARLAKLGTH